MRVLIIDDSFSYTVSIFNDKADMVLGTVDQAMELVKETPSPDLVIIEPAAEVDEKEGFRLVSKIVKMGLPVVILSRYECIEDWRNQALETGARAVCSKFETG